MFNQICGQISFALQNLSFCFIFFTLKWMNESSMCLHANAHKKSFCFIRYFWNYEKLVFDWKSSGGLFVTDAHYTFKLNIFSIIRWLDYSNGFHVNVNICLWKTNMLYMYKPSIIFFPKNENTVFVVNHFRKKFNCKFSFWVQDLKHLILIIFHFECCCSIDFSMTTEMKKSITILYQMDNLYC